MTRLNKHIAFILGVSRREADLLIEKGSVGVDGKPAQLGQQIEARANVTVDGKEIAQTSELAYVALNKPSGYVCSRRQQGDSPTIYSLLPPRLHHLKPVGRLDRDSSGIILLTNDGDFAHRMTHPKFSKIKIYEVELDHPLKPLHQQMISDNGVKLEDGASKFLVEKLEPPKPIPSNSILSGHLQPKNDQTSGLLSNVARSRSENRQYKYKITMHEGRNRQIRRTFGSLGYTVTKLHRIQFGNFCLANLSLKPQQWCKIDIQLT